MLPDRTVGGARQASLADMAQPGYRSDRFATSRAARFSSKSSNGCSSDRNTDHSTFALGGKCQTGEYVLVRQLRKIGQKLLLAHTRGEVREHITHGDARPPHAGLPKTNFGVNNDSASIIHRLEISDRAKGDNNGPGLTRRRE